MSKTRTEFVEKCKDVMHKHLDKRNMIITYLRGSTPRFYGAKPTQKEAEQIREMLNVAPDLTPEGYFALLRVMGQKVKKDQKEEVKKKFLTARSYWRSRRQPRIGTVIAFKKKDQIYIGWSMCRSGAKVVDPQTGKTQVRAGDKFDRYIGVYEALRVDEVGEYVSAFPIENQRGVVSIINLIARTEEMLEESRGLSRDKPRPQTDIPHTILPHVKAMVERAKRHFGEKKK